MAKRKPEKRIIFLEPDFSDVLVCQKNSFRPYIEIISQEGENISQQSLGTLLGVFEITDESEDSSYIVNFIISVIKKEYFSKSKRGPIESFESALHKANLALSKLAQHENINWIGKFNALVAVIEKNGLHFSQTGKASALLLRNGFLTDISEGMSEEETPNPLKTFSNLSSGKLDEGDKLILATPEIFEIFSLEEIKKSALRFSKEDFVQFLRTALGNELEKTAVLVIDIREREEQKRKTSPKKQADFNAFSQKAFIPKPRSQEEKKDIIQEFEEVLKNDAPEKTKHGHIYIKEELEISENGLPPERKAEIGKAFKDFLGKTRERASGKKIKEFSGQVGLKIKKARPGEKIKKISIFLWRNILVLSRYISSKIKSIRLSQRKKIISPSVTNNLPPMPGQKNIFSIIKKIIPDFSKIKYRFDLLSSRQKIYILASLFLIFIIPFFIAKKMNAPKEDASPQSIQEEAAKEEPLDSNRSADSIQPQNISEISSENGIEGIFNLNDIFFAVKRDSIVQLPENKSWPVPQDFGEISHFAAMDDLNVIFIVNKENQILSFFPTSQKFQENNFTLPNGSQIQALGTFMTYLYVLDSKNNQIYRYPRAEGGFGEKTDWLKEPADLGEFSNMTVTDNIYLWNKNDLAKFSRGKKEELILENSPDFDYFYADENFLFALNTGEGTIKKFDLTGKFVSEIYSEKIKTATSLAVSDDSNTFYISSSDKIISLAN